MISEARALLAHSYLLNFCKGLEQLYGMTPNMYLHTHLVDYILEYGPVYSFWLFSFERYNGIKGDYGTNQRSVEIQLMRKFTSNQFVKDLPLPTEFQEQFKPVMERLVSRQSGSLQEYCSNEETTSRNLITSSMFCIGPVHRGRSWSAEDSLFVCYGQYYRDCLGEESLPHLKECYRNIFDVDESSLQPICFVQFFWRKIWIKHFTRRQIILHSSKVVCTSRKNGHDLRPGVIEFFMEQIIKVNTLVKACIL